MAYKPVGADEDGHFPPRVEAALAATVDTQGAASVGNVSSSWWTTLLAMLKSIFVQKNPRTYNVADYGAKGDGVTDDTAALNAAWAAVPTDGPSVFHVPPGVYNHTRVTFVGKNNVTVTGHGATLYCTVLTGQYVTFEACDRLTVKGLTTTSGATVRTGGVANRGLYVKNCTNWTVTECTATNTGTSGIWVYGSSHGRIINNNVLNTWADGLDITNGSHDIVVSGNTMHNTGDDAIAVLSEDTAPENLCYNITITGNKSSFSKARGIVVHGGKNVTISGNAVTDSRYANVLVMAGSSSIMNALGTTNISVVGNTLHRANTYAPEAGTNYAAVHILSNSDAYPVDGVIVDGNVISEPAYFAVLVGKGSGSGTFNVTVANNVIKDAVTTGIVIQAARDVRVNGNNLVNIGGPGVTFMDVTTGALQIANNVLRNTNTVSGTYVIGTLGLATLTGAQINGNSIIAPGAFNPTNSIAAASSTGLIVSGNYPGGLVMSGVVSTSDFVVNANVLIGGATPTSGKGGGVGVFGIRNASTVPSSNPTNGGVLYADAGGLKYRGSGGTVTTIAPA